MTLRQTQPDGIVMNSGVLRGVPRRPGILIRLILTSCSPGPTEKAWRRDHRAWQPAAPVSREQYARGISASRHLRFNCQAAEVIAREHNLIDVMRGLGLPHPSSR